MNPIVYKFLRSKWWESLLIALAFSAMAFSMDFKNLFNKHQNNDFFLILNGTALVLMSLGVFQLWFQFIRFHRWWSRVKKDNENPVLPKWIRLHTDAQLGMDQSDSQILSRILLLSLIVFVPFLFVSAITFHGWPKDWKFLWSSVSCFLIAAMLVLSSYSLWIEKHYCEYMKKQSKRNIRYV